MFRTILPILFILGNVPHLFAQTNPEDSGVKGEKRTLVNGEMHYDIGNGKILVYSKPKSFGFITNLPKDAANIGSTIFKKESMNIANQFINVSFVILAGAKSNHTLKVTR